MNTGKTTNIIAYAQKSYFWKTTTDYLNNLLRIKIGEVDNEQHLIEVEAFYVDQWLRAENPHFSKQNNAIEDVTPAFIREAINFAIAHSWNSKPTLRLQYENRTFKVIR